MPEQAIGWWMMPEQATSGGSDNLSDGWDSSLDRGSIGKVSKVVSQSPTRDMSMCHAPR